ncbi:MAG: response regulator [Burkholderiales bacterium]|nr:response regulator [Burkholderiales bacterium]MDE1929011.1 response regulator [Burkholderiales bacterium]MDE2160967.1 response regulator [Burkholderiales bacterium]MDE2503577.1 response regulator [Burkholderiales bacterium]
MGTHLQAPDHGHVLAVDDCATMREILRTSLESAGCSVDLVDSGWAALEAAAQARYDAIILDVEMPGLDGLAVGRALRQDPRTARAMIAIHTSIEEAAVRAGFSQYDLYLPKAGSPRELGEHVLRMIRGRRHGA